MDKDEHVVVSMLIPIKFYEFQNKTFAPSQLPQWFLGKYGLLGRWEVKKYLTNQHSFYSRHNRFYKLLKTANKKLQSTSKKERLNKSTGSSCQHLSVITLKFSPQMPLLTTHTWRWSQYLWKTDKPETALDSRFDYSGA